MSRFTLRHFVEVLRPGARGLQDVRAALRKAHADVSVWKRRYERWSRSVKSLKASVRSLKADVARRKRQLDAARRHADACKRNGLTTGVLEQILPLRARQRPILGCDMAAAQERERRLFERSGEYRRLVGNGDNGAAALERLTVGGLTWWLPRDDDGGAAGRLEKLQRQGFPLRALLQAREVSLGGVVLDLGANVGRTSIPRVLLGDARAVYAAEPDPVNFACLVQNVSEHGLRGFVLPDRVAIGAARGEAWLRRSRFIGGHRVVSEADDRAGARCDRERVQLWPLDQWLEKVGADPRGISFVKVDTQGSEVQVLHGARELLARRHVSWQIEVDPGLLAHAGSTLRELVAVLEGHFTHFIDIGSNRPGSRARSLDLLAESLAYLGKDHRKTDVILYSAA